MTQTIAIETTQVKSIINLDLFKLSIQSNIIYQRSSHIMRPKISPEPTQASSALTNRDQHTNALYNNTLPLTPQKYRISDGRIVNVSVGSNAPQGAHSIMHQSQSSFKPNRQQYQLANARTSSRAMHPVHANPAMHPVHANPAMHPVHANPSMHPANANHGYFLQPDYHQQPSGTKTYMGFLPNRDTQNEVQTTDNQDSSSSKSGGICFPALWVLIGCLALTALIIGILFAIGVLGRKHHEAPASHQIVVEGVEYDKDSITIESSVINTEDSSQSPSSASNINPDMNSPLTPSIRPVNPTVTVKPNYFYTNGDASRPYSTDPIIMNPVPSNTYSSSPTVVPVSPLSRSSERYANYQTSESIEPIRMNPVPSNALLPAKMIIPRESSPASVEPKPIIFTRPIRIRQDYLVEPIKWTLDPSNSGYYIPSTYPNKQ